jgi:hypothetical protein
MTTHGAFSWVEYHGQDAQTARTFYENVLGWTVADLPMADGSSYPGILLGEQPVGGFAPKCNGGGHPDGSAWLAYVTVDDVDARAKAAADSGGQLLAGPFDAPGVGRIAIVQDPTGASLALITYAQT